MYFAIISEDVPESLPLRLAVRPAHLHHLEALRQENRLLLAGPFPRATDEEPDALGFSGSLIVADFDSLADCLAWADADPYVKAGVFATRTIKPFKKVLP
ncbi:MAG: YciI family protein [Magnetococcales bacterium]|nr:YciI family protein [Magnetococcales bacterium]